MEGRQDRVTDVETCLDVLTKGDAARFWDWPPAVGDAFVGVVVAVRCGGAPSLSARVQSKKLAVRGILGGAVAYLGVRRKGVVSPNGEECSVVET